MEHFDAFGGRLETKDNDSFLREIIQVIPSIGFNVETVCLRVPSGKAHSELNLTCWDVGGCGRTHLTNTIAMYIAPVDAIIWIIDSSDRERLPESIAEFSAVMARAAADTSAPRKERPVLILATKQDLPNAMSIDEIRMKTASALAGMSSFGFGIGLTHSLVEGTIPDAFGWLLMALESARKGTALPSTPAPAPKVLSARDPSVLDDRLSSWLARSESDTSPEEFLRQFETINLPAWDHYTHIRIAYLNLTIHGRQKGKDLIFEGIEQYIQQSSQTKGRTFHVTMTYFWIQMVHFGIRSTPPLGYSASNSEFDNKAADHHDQDDFSRFLLLNPHLADGNLWADYYSKDLMMSPAAKTGPVLPDIKPLPNLVVRDAISKSA
ncbi:ADP-ribosylation factor [Favolaschia claudopus]|uniref:ADP-ribosylation factor n=1 Tax=Favolaschia claudopus TaxID=2862362 RepID=A0AAV9ZVJ7_9AGAR